MTTTANEAGPIGHNQLEWPKVRKRSALLLNTESDWSNASPQQRGHMHQIELAVKSITVEDLSELEE